MHRTIILLVTSSILCACADSTEYASSLSPVGVQAVPVRERATPQPMRLVNYQTETDDSAPVKSSRISGRDWDLLFRTVYGEARNQSDNEIRGIINVIYNRWISGVWGDTLKDVLLADRQFSVWNRGDRSRRIITNDDLIDWDKMDHVEDLCKEVFNARFNGGKDITHNATHFYHPHSMQSVRYFYRKHGKRYKAYKRLRPEWSYGSPKIRIGDAIFVRRSF